MRYYFNSNTSISDAPEAFSLEIVGHHEEIETEIGMKLIQKSLR